MPYRVGAERSWSLCAPSAAKLERTAAVVRTVITVLTVITACGGEAQPDRNRAACTQNKDTRNEG